MGLHCRSSTHQVASTLTNVHLCLERYAPTFASTQQKSRPFGLLRNIRQPSACALDAPQANDEVTGKDEYCNLPVVIYFDGLPFATLVPPVCVLFVLALFAPPTVLAHSRPGGPFWSVSQNHMQRLCWCAGV
jgi:hypothetical protein|mmetsp:Transcript_9738/g.18349  ORF Transcript_9738/g.18349 Transcript_9738/m.18349 type:complete len:132 (+) Transcript_9738:1144-1539(+)